jgi:hypothetical protein
VRQNMKEGWSCPIGRIERKSSVGLLRLRSVRDRRMRREFGTESNAFPTAPMWLRERNTLLRTEALR